jgi:hypothetical protein
MTVFSFAFALILNAQDFSVKSTKQVVASEIPKAVLFDQSPDGTLTSGIVSVVNNTGAGVYATDDFTLDAEFNIQSITAYGFSSDLNFESTVTGINIYVYANSATNTPDGDPTQLGTGLLELVEIDPFGPAVEIISSGDGGFDIKVDIEAANGSSVSLPAGDYWLVVAPTQNIVDFGNVVRWNWFGAGEGAFGNSSAHLIDPTNAFGGDFTEWISFSDLGIGDFQSTAFIIEGESSFDFPLPYCALEFTTVGPLTSVEFAGIANRTDAVVNGTPAHEDFISVSGDVLAGEEYEIALQGNTSGGFTNRFAVFIDWNQNDVLDDDGEVYEIVETIFTSGGNDGIEATQILTVPADALSGKTRMRVKKILGNLSILDPCIGANFGQTEDYSINVTLPLARLQVVHNSPDPAVEVVDVYVNGGLLLDDFAFRTATPFIDVPANTPLTIDIAPGTSVDVSESVFTVSPTLTADETYIAVASGTLESSLSLEVFAGAREVAAVAGNTDVLLQHGSPDAPTVDVVNQDGGAILVDDISYTEFQGYLELPTDDYLIDITNADGSTKVAGYQAYLAELGLADAAVTVFASGFLDPGANQDGPAFGLWVSLASGGALVELNDEDFIEFPAPYCGPLEHNVVEPMTYVEFAGIANRSNTAVSITPAHEDFTRLSGDVLAGESYEIALEGNTDGAFTNRFAVFVDWNQNDVLDDAGEVYEITQTIEHTNGEDGQQAIQTLAVPADALAGETRMRIKKLFGDFDYLNPCLGTSYGQVEDYSINVTLPTARVQVVHNSPDPAVEVVDVYLNGDLFLDDFAFRTATPFIDAPANTPITIDIAPGTSVDVSESIFTVSPTLATDESYIVVASGVLGSSFSLEVFAGAREAAAVDGNTDVLVHHGSPDAPTVDVVNQDGASVLVNNISYKEFQGYLELPTADYLIDITTTDGSTKVAGYQAYLAELGLADAAVTVFASGFLDPGANQDGPAFGLWVSLASGGALVELNDEAFVPIPALYCGPLGFTEVQPITNVEFLNLTNRSSAAITGSVAHENFTSLVADVTAGESFDIVLEGNTAGPFKNAFVIFIDWNQNDALDDAGEVYEILETIDGSTGEDGQQAIQSLEIPAGQADGLYRMRVKKIYFSTTLPPTFLDPCADENYGQAEDYTISVGTLSNTSFNSTDFTFYPNPINDILSISTASTVDNIKVYNMLGQMVVETAPKVSNPQVDMDELQSGVYLVTLEVEGSLQTFRVIKQ